MKIEYQIFFLILSGIGGYVFKSKVKCKSNCKCCEFEFINENKDDNSPPLKKIVITQPTLNLKKSKSRAKIDTKDLSSSSESNTGSL